jgi:hypothetical protein
MDVVNVPIGLQQTHAPRKNRHGVGAVIDGQKAQLGIGAIQPPAGSVRCCWRGPWEMGPLVPGILPHSLLTHAPPHSGYGAHGGAKMPCKNESEREWREWTKKERLCHRCRRPVYRGGRCKECYERQREANDKWREKVRKEVFDAYGGKCACCGETKTAFLSIDHINQDGAARRRAKLDGTGAQLYSQLRSRGFPPGYRLLCHNCNIASFNSKDGRCPHNMGCFALPSVN